MQRLEVSGAVRPLYWPLGVKGLRNKKKCPPNTRKRKIVIIGDSHARGYAAEISNGLGKDFDVTGTVMPGARLENILADNEVSTLGKSDTVIVMEGANVISKHETNFRLKHLGNFINSRHNTNIMIVTALIDLICRKHHV